MEEMPACFGGLGQSNGSAGLAHSPQPTTPSSVDDPNQDMIEVLLAAGAGLERVDQGKTHDAQKFTWSSVDRTEGLANRPAHSQLATRPTKKCERCFSLNPVHARSDHRNQSIGMVLADDFTAGPGRECLINPKLSAGGNLIDVAGGIESDSGGQVGRRIDCPGIDRYL